MFVLYSADSAGEKLTIIESMSFANDNSRIVVAKLTARSVLVHDVPCRQNIRRTISIVSVNDGTCSRPIADDWERGVTRFSSSIWCRGRQSVLFVPNTGQVISTAFGYVDSLHLNLEKQPAGTTQLGHPASHIAVSNSGELVAVSGSDSLTVLNTQSRSVALECNSRIPPVPMLFGRIIAFSPGDQIVAVAGVDRIECWDIKAQQLVAMISPPVDSMISSIAFGRNKTVFVSSGRWTRQYDFSGKQVESFLENGGCGYCYSSSDGNRLATLGNTKLRTFATNPKIQLAEVEVSDATVAAISPDGSLVAVGDQRGIVSLFEFETGNLVWTTEVAGKHGITWYFPASCLLAWSCIATAIVIRRNRS